MQTNTIICGDALTELKKFDNECIDMCITSPPYWGLRDYKCKSTIWGGDENCEHEWGDKVRTLTHKSGETNPGKEGWFKDRGASDDGGSSFCSICNAWRGQLGLEPTFDSYIDHLCTIFDQVKRVLKKEGTCWINLGDTYSTHGGSKNSKHSHNFYKPEVAIKEGIYKPKPSHRMQGLEEKCLCQIPSRFSIEMCNRGWILRNTIIWHKPNCMPSSVKDRFTVDFEYLFFFAKQGKYYFEQQFEAHVTQENRPDGIVRNREYGYDSKLNALNKKENTPRQKRGGNKNPDYLSLQGRNKRCVWKIATKPYKEAHFAVFPPELIETPIKAGCPKGGIVLDPFMGSGTTAMVAKSLQRNYIGIDIQEGYLELQDRRSSNIQTEMF